MTLKETIGVALAPFLFALFVWSVPRWWRNERGLHTDTPPPSWVWSRRFWHALVRVWMPLTISFLIAIPPTVVTMFVTDGLVYVLSNALLAIVGFMWLFIIPSVWFFNRPRVLVAPHHRALPGWLAERRGAPVPPVPEPRKPPKWHLAPR